jgi:hypothetical protein
VAVSVSEWVISHRQPCPRGWLIFRLIQPVVCLGLQATRHAAQEGAPSLALREGSSDQTEEEMYHPRVLPSCESPLKVEQWSVDQVR